MLDDENGTTGLNGMTPRPGHMRSGWGSSMRLLITSLALAATLALGARAFAERAAGPGLA